MPKPRRTTLSWFCCRNKIMVYLCTMPHCIKTIRTKPGSIKLPWLGFQPQSHDRFTIQASTHKTIMMLPPIQCIIYLCYKHQGKKQSYHDLCSTTKTAIPWNMYAPVLIAYNYHDQASVHKKLSWFCCRCKNVIDLCTDNQCIKLRWTGFVIKILIDVCTEACCINVLWHAAWCTVMILLWPQIMICLCHDAARINLSWFCIVSNIVIVWCADAFV